MTCSELMEDHVFAFFVIWPASPKTSALFRMAQSSSSGPVQLGPPAHSHTFPLASVGSFMELSLKKDY